MFDPDDIETKGYGLPYLGIKPTAVGVVPVVPLPAMSMMPSIPVMPPSIPAMPQPKPIASPKLAHVSTPTPILKPTPSLIKEPPKSTLPEQFKTPSLSQTSLPFEMPQQFKIPEYIKPLGMEDEDDSNMFPSSLQQPQMPVEKPLGSFNKLNGLLNKGKMR